MKKLFIAVIMLYSSLLNAQWFSNSAGVTSDLKQVIFLNNNTGWIVGNSGKILMTTNSGANWAQMVSGTSENLNSIVFTTHYSDSSFLIACGDNGTLIRSRDMGLNWYSINLGTSQDLNFVSEDPDRFGKSMYVVGDNGIQYRSTNDGVNWSLINTNTTEQLNNIIFFFDAVSGYSVYSLGNNGVARVPGGNGWISPQGFPTTSQNLSGSSFKAFISPTKVFLFVCTESGNVLRKQNHQLPWLQFSTGVSSPLRSLSGVGRDGGRNTGGIIWAVGDNGIVRRSADTGNTWGSQGVPINTNLHSIYMISADSGWIVGGGGAIFKTVNGGGPVGITQISSEVPSQFTLMQNYPNPFNPSTKIRFDISNSSFARLKVFDMLGKEVAMLLNEKLDAGKYEYTFEGGDLKSGVYFYKLEVEGYTEIRKMVLIK